MTGYGEQVRNEAENRGRLPTRRQHRAHSRADAFEVFLEAIEHFRTAPRGTAALAQFVQFRLQRLGLSAQFGLLLQQFLKCHLRGSQLLLHLGIALRKVRQYAADCLGFGARTLAFGALPRPVALQSLDLRPRHVCGRMPLCRAADDRELLFAIGLHLLHDLRQRGDHCVQCGSRFVGTLLFRAHEFRRLCGLVDRLRGFGFQRAQPDRQRDPLLPRPQQFRIVVRGLFALRFDRRLELCNLLSRIVQPLLVFA